MSHLEEYNSSEELALAHRQSVFAEEQKKQEEEAATASQRHHKVLDKYIKIHSSTVTVRKLAKENKAVDKYGADYQLDLSADLVDVLTKIKKEMR